MQIPSYFALILRAFSVIEGIALRVDPQYSIVQECFPYIARRLLTDNHPRTRAALQQLLYAVRLLPAMAQPIELCNLESALQVGCPLCNALPRCNTCRGGQCCFCRPCNSLWLYHRHEYLKV